MSTKLKLNCKNCGRIFWRYRVRVRAGFCSRSCWSEFQSRSGRRIAKCFVCDKEIIKVKSRVLRNKRNYCSNFCRYTGQSKFLTGKDSANWRGGKTSEALKIRHSKKYRLFVQQILIRDKFTCRFCGKRGGRLQVDHYKPFSLYPELRFLEGNCRTLCLECHQKTPTYLYKSRKQLNPYFFW